jgi:hypothetical protein
LKLRIRRNSIRLRLGESEVAKLVRGERVTEDVQFSQSPPIALTYSLATSSQDTQIAARLAANEIQITVPVDLAKQWGNSGDVGMSHEQRVGTDATLSIVIEKDFRCLVPRPGEDESDNFARPGLEKNCTGS